MSFGGSGSHGGSIASMGGDDESRVMEEVRVASRSP
jgi:hypothetical protein